MDFTEGNLSVYSCERQMDRQRHTKIKKLRSIQKKMWVTPEHYMPYNSILLPIITPLINIFHLFH